MHLQTHGILTQQKQHHTAPHTHCPAGVALVWARRGAAAATADGAGEEEGGEGEEALAISAGGVIESAAYNPSLPPLQAALVAAVAAGMAGWGAVRAAVLVERRSGDSGSGGGGARVSHLAATRAAAACLGRGGGAGEEGEGVPVAVFRVRWAEGDGA